MDKIKLFATPEQSEIGRSLQCWPMVTGRLRPIAVSIFGDVFFERPDGSIHRLDPLEGKLSCVASSITDFERLLQDKGWVDANLMVSLAALAVERGIHRDEREVFAFGPHPIFTGKLLVEQIQPMSLFAWHAVCSQLFANDQTTPSPKG